MAVFAACSIAGALTGILTGKASIAAVAAGSGGMASMTSSGMMMAAATIPGGGPISFIAGSLGGSVIGGVASSVLATWRERRRLKYSLLPVLPPPAPSPPSAVSICSKA